MNGYDDDCDGLIDNNTVGYDDDGDGLTELEGDCDDTNAAIHPEEEERQAMGTLTTATGLLMKVVKI